jgi:hypothetical protein
VEVRQRLNHTNRLRIASLQMTAQFNNVQLCFDFRWPWNIDNCPKLSSSRGNVLILLHGSAWTKNAEVFVVEKVPHINAVSK